MKTWLSNKQVAELIRNLALGEAKQITENLDLATTTAMDQKASEKCLHVLRKLKENKLANLFLKPVDPQKEGIPNYLEVIKKPMDLGTIEVS